MPCAQSVLQNRLGVPQSRLNPQRHARCTDAMRVFAISSRNLALLDAELGGRLSAALVEVARSGFDPEIRITRSDRTQINHRLGRLSLVVMESNVSFLPTIHWSQLLSAHASTLIDFSAELKADLACRGQAHELIDDIDGHLPWRQRTDGGGEPS